MPAPRWFVARSEYEYIIQSLNRLVEAGPAREPGLAPIPSVPRALLGGPDRQRFAAHGLRNRDVVVLSLGWTNYIQGVR
jgi:hypothetical protein